MLLSVAIVFEDSSSAKSYYSEFDSSKGFSIGGKRTDLPIPDFEKTILITPASDPEDAGIRLALVSEPGKSESFETPLGSFCTIEKERSRKTVLMISKVEESPDSLWLSEGKEYHLGRQQDDSNDVWLKTNFISRHHFSIEKRCGRVSVKADPHNSNGLFLNGEKIELAELKKGDVLSTYTAQFCFDGKKLIFRNVPCEIRKDCLTPEEPNVPNQETIFRRSARNIYRVEEKEIFIEAPPALMEKPQIDPLTTFLPAVITVIMGVVMSVAFHGVGMLYTIPLTLSGVIISLINYKKQSRKYENDVETSTGEYEEALTAAETELKNFNSNMLDCLLKTDPDTADCISLACDLDPTMWDRGGNDEDFLSVRVGSGKVRTAADMKVAPPSGKCNEDLKKAHDRIVDTYSYVSNAPITCNLAENHVIGILGSKKATDALINDIIVQLTYHHAYTDLRIVYLYSGENSSWAKDLPHIGGLAASDKEKADSIIEEVLKGLEQRADILSNNNTYGKAPSFRPHILFIVQDSSLLSKNPDINAYILGRNDLSVSMIMAAEEIMQLPKETKLIIHNSVGGWDLYQTANAGKKIQVKPDGVTQKNLLRYAKQMNMVRLDEPVQTVNTPAPGESASTGAGIPTKYSLFQMLGISDVKELNLEKRWSESDASETLSAPVGIGANGIVKLNIFGTAEDDGPHGLVCGTTGSGKTAFLVSYFLALATAYSPEDLVFAVGDFKGTALCDQMMGLPHLSSRISNIKLDKGSHTSVKKDVERFIDAITGELQYRQSLLAETNKKLDLTIVNISQYMRLYKTGKVSEPMPHLIIVIDEFAEFKKQYPEYYDQLVSVALQGNSLGLHLILATQTPSGNINALLNANLKTRICLMVKKVDDSNEVIYDPRASTILNAGRAYLLGGNNELVLLQSGFGGKDDLSERQLVIDHIRKYCAEHKETIPQIFMEPLSETDPYSSDGVRGDNIGTVALGVYDDPRHKTQTVYSVPLLDSNLIIIGSAKTGKTNLLQVIIHNLAERYSPEEVNVYILDFASEVLVPYEKLNHVGGVITSGEDEKLKQLMRILNREYTTRKAKLRKVGATTLEQYRANGNTDIPHIVVIIDNLAKFNEAYNDLYGNDLVTFCKDGLSLGISVIVANTDTQNGISFKLLPYFGSRIALNNNNPNVYSDLFGGLNWSVDKIPGRCLVCPGEDVLDAQLYLALEVGMTIDDYCKKIHALWGERMVQRIPEVPKSLGVPELLEMSPALNKAPYSVSIGLDYETVEPLVCDLAEIACLSLSGGKPEDQSKYLEALIWQLNTLYPTKAKVWILDGKKGQLTSVAQLPNVARYCIKDGDLPGIIAELENLASARKVMLDLDEKSLDNAELLVLVINSPSVGVMMEADSTAQMTFENLITTYKDMKICVLVSNVPNASWISSPFYNKAAANKQILWFEDLSGLQLISLPFTVTKRFNKSIDKGDAFILDNMNCKKLKHPVCSETAENEGGI